MKRALVLASLIALMSSAHADNREKWQVTFAAAVTVDIFGAIMVAQGKNQLNDAKQQLCDGGAYANMPGCATGFPKLTSAEVDSLNAKGFHGQTEARIGALTVAVSTVVVGVALYGGFIKKRPPVMVAPDLGHDHAGAALQLQW